MPPVEKDRDRADRDSADKDRDRDEDSDTVDVPETLLQRLIYAGNRTAKAIETLVHGMAALTRQIADLEERVTPVVDAYKRHLDALEAADSRETLAYRNAKAGVFELLTNKVVIGAVVTALGAGIGLGGGSSRMAAVFRALTSPAVVTDPPAKSADPLQDPVSILPTPSDPPDDPSVPGGP